MGANDTGNDPTFPTPPPADRPVFVVAIPAPSIRPETAAAQEATGSSWSSPFVYNICVILAPSYRKRFAHWPWKWWRRF